MLGLKRGEVRLLEHEKEWETTAQSTIGLLREILGGSARDIQHVGSTSIPHIRAKPIIDIAVGTDDLDDVMRFAPALEAAGVIHRPVNDDEGQRFFACGDFAADTRTHHIHVVRYGSKEWQDYLGFRDYLTRFPEEARLYEREKLRLAELYGGDRAAYTEGKSDIIRYLLRRATQWAWLGGRACVEIDRPVGYVHKKEGHTLIYPINYGYIPGVWGGDGEELDVYVLGETRPLSRFEGRVIAAVCRRDDVEDKLVAAPEGMRFTRDEIAEAVRFQEKYHDSFVRMADEP